MSRGASYPSPAVRPYLTQEHPLRFGHRGSNLLWPQNTMVAFCWAMDLGLRYLETDVHVSRDGRRFSTGVSTGRGQVPASCTSTWRLPESLLCTNHEAPGPM